ncbi:MAG: hypothetical protein V3U45_07960 [bacterium]
MNDGAVRKIWKDLEAMERRIVKLEAFMKAAREDTRERHKYGLRAQIPDPTTLKEAVEIIRRSEGLD